MGIRSIHAGILRSEGGWHWACCSATDGSVQRSFQPRIWIEACAPRPGPRRSGRRILGGMFACRLQQAAFERLEAAGGRQLLAEQVGDIEGVRCAFAVGGDMRGVKDRKSVE